MEQVQRAEDLIHAPRSGFSQRRQRFSQVVLSVQCAHSGVAGSAAQDLWMVPDLKVEGKVRVQGFGFRVSGLRMVS